jgi:methionyl-tRNA formyltransferase
MRLVYFGSPAAAVPPLRALHGAGHDIALVVTQPDRRRGRTSALEPTEVKRCALELGLEVRTPQRSREVVDEVVALEAALGVVVAFGQLLPAALLHATAHGFVNVHFSLLPRWRGAAPVERAILAGDHETGVAVMAVEETLDTGGIFAEVRTPIGDAETAGELRDRLVALGTELLVREIDRVPGATPAPQVGEETYAAKLEVSEFELDPVHAPAVELARLVRAGNPAPGAWCAVGGRRLKVLRARPVAGADVGLDERVPGTISDTGVLSCREGGLMLDEVQPEGKRSMAGVAWMAGQRGEVTVDG